MQPLLLINVFNKTMVELLVFLTEHNKTINILQALKKIFKDSLLFKLQKIPAIYLLEIPTFISYF